MCLTRDQIREERENFKRMCDHLYKQYLHRYFSFLFSCDLTLQPKQHNDTQAVLLSQATTIAISCNRKPSILGWLRQRYWAARHSHLVHNPD